MLSEAELDRIRRDYAAPYYLAMYSNGPALAPELAVVARAATEEEILFMLGTEEWRVRRVGAWFSIARMEPSIAGAVLESLEGSRGTLTAYELMAAAILLAPERALTSLQRYEAQAIEKSFGGLDATAAGIRHLGGTPAAGDPDAGQSRLDWYLEVGREIQTP